MISKIQNAIFSQWGVRVPQALIVLIPISLVLLVILLVQLSMRTPVEELSPQERVMHDKEVENDLRALDNSTF